MQVITAIQNFNYEGFFEKAVKYAKENPAVAGAAGVGVLFTVVSICRKSTMRRDGQDYNSALGGVNLLNNAVSRLVCSFYFVSYLC